MTDTLPMIRLEVAGMKHQITHALMAHQAKMDADIINAVEAYCQPENISRVIHEAARSALDAAIKEEVKNFFWFGPGRVAVAEAVKTKLLNNETFTPLDEV